MFIFVSHNVLTEKESPIGYSMLRVLRSYLDLDMWESLEVQTSDTIEQGRQSVTKFSVALQVCIFYQCLKGFH
jgi:hypothetical protein